MLQANRNSTTPAKAASRSISDLYKDLEKATAECRSIPEGKGYDSAVRKCCIIARALVKTRARTVAEMLLKIKVAGWSAGAGGAFDLDKFDNWRPDQQTEGDEFKVLVSLRGDLRRLCREGNIALTEPFNA